MPTEDLLTILQTLTDHEVEFVVVGGVCAVLQGAPISTFDLDIVHARGAENVDRLLQALDSIDAYYRGPHPRKHPPERSALHGPGHQLLMTRAGPLDVLGIVGDNRSYEGLLPFTVTLEIRPNLKLRVLKLATLIEVKEEAGREKDRAMLPILRRTLDELTKG